MSVDGVQKMMQNRVDQVQQLQEQQRLQEDRNKLNTDPAIDQAKESNLNGASDNQEQNRELVAQDASSRLVAEIQNGQATREMDADLKDHVSGAEKSGEAVDTSHAQQTQGENWEKFAQQESTAALPPSVAEVANEDARADAAKQEGAQQERQQIRAQDLLKDMAIQNSHIKS
ncbi:hypothetical protein KAI87_16135 [Myxococcota bacterium]|nr:hypothetical protein [Myxococcota bacterium]